MGTVLAQVFDALATYTGASRLYALRVGATELLVEAFAADDALHEVGMRDLIVLSTSAFLDIGSLLGQPASLRVRLGDGTSICFDGEVCAAAMLGGDGGLARYRLLVAPWTWRLAHVRRSRVWQDRGVVEIVDAVFETYRPAAHWRWNADVAAFLADTPVRSYCCQYRESDLDFVRRLLAEEGLCWRFEQDADGPVMVLFADSTAPDLSGIGRVPYHADSALEQGDGVQALQARRSVQASLTTLLSSDYKAHRSIAAAAPSPLATAALPVLEDYEVPGQYAFADRAHARHQAEVRMQAHEARVEEWTGRSTVRALRAGTRLAIAGTPLRRLDGASAFTVVRVTSVGINNLPPAAALALAELFGPIPELLEELAHDHEQERWPEDMDAVVAQAMRSGYANRFEAIPAGVPWRPPIGDIKPTAFGTQSAIVVGANGSDVPNGADELYCDRLGRVRIRFHWQDGPATCWVRVAQRAAGCGMGSQFLPRIGQEVLVQFIENDIDRPVIVGALYNGQGEGGKVPTPGGVVTSADDVSCFEAARDGAPSGQGNRAGGNAPLWHGASAGSAGHRNAGAQWGVRSKEFGGRGYNQLLFDDTDAQGRVQLRCTHAGSELNLGHLIHAADNYRGSFRGLGAELRSDAGGAVRAGAGLLVSSYAIAQTVSSRDPVGSNEPGVGMLQQALQLAGAFHPAAMTHRTAGLAAHAGTFKANASVLDDKAAPLAAMHAALAGTVDKDLGGPLPHFSAPLIAISARDGIGATAGENLQLANGETVSLVSGMDTQYAVGGTLSIQTGQAIGVLGGAVKAGADGLQLIAAREKIDIQAQADELKVQGRDAVDVVSANAHIDWAAAKRISLSTAGGANITIEGGSILVQCPGKLRIAAGKKCFEGPAQADYEVPAGVRLVEDNLGNFNRFDEQFHVVDKNDIPVADVGYRIVASTGEIFEGITDAKGFTTRVKTRRPATLEIEILDGSTAAEAKD
jgi:type VI secretion system secreted protein VgrG